MLPHDLERAVAAAAEEAATELINRTESGKDIKGAAFKAYKPSYLKYKKSIGKWRGWVNLTLTGDMLKAIHTRVEKGAGYVQAVIYMNPDQTEKAKENQERGREFFGLTAKQIKALVTRIKEELFSGR